MKIKTMSFTFLMVILTLTASLARATAGKNLELTSKNLNPGQSIPSDYYANIFGCSANNTSPDLTWKNAPAGTKSFALTVHDESAPTGSGFWHYVLINIPADVRQIETDDLNKGRIPAGSVETMTDAGKPGYFGPCPPAGRTHTYLFTIHALKVEKLDVPLSSTPGFVGFNLWVNSLGKASFTVTAGPR